MPRDGKATCLPVFFARSGWTEGVQFMRSVAGLSNRLACALVALMVAGAGAAQVPAQPEATVALQRVEPAYGTQAMVVTAHPLASQAALSMLDQGGSAADAAIAAQWVLGLVEPQSSGLGGGGFALHHDAETRRTMAYSGREIAPAEVLAEDFRGTDARGLSFDSLVASARSVGVPGTPALLERLHRDHGRLPWARLFEPAIRLAREGFSVSPRLHALIARDAHLSRQPAARAYFFDEAGQALATGHLLRNPEYAAVLDVLARDGAQAFYRYAHPDGIARDVLDALGAQSLRGRMSAGDLERYGVDVAPPVCGVYRGWRVCGPPPPSSGAVALLQVLGVMEGFAPERDPMSVGFIHRFSEAGRLAYADRAAWLGDPAAMRVPVAALLDQAYLARRRSLIQPARAMGKAEAGDPVAHRSEGQWAAEYESTTHLSIVDRQGNALSMTSSIEDAFGSRILVRGFLLNNQLTDFALEAPPGHPNAPLGGRHPLSSMAPTLVFDASGRLEMLLGSPGGSRIINYVAQCFLAMADAGMAPAAAVALPHVGSRNGPTELETGVGLDRQADVLRALGHTVLRADMNSGLHVIRRHGEGWVGAADPRREGRALGR